MNDIIQFLNHYYDQALLLSHAFEKTRKCSWNALIILNELSIQIGQIYNIIYQNDVVNEGTRRFSNLGDELSDVILQLIALADVMNINMFQICNDDFSSERNFMALPILFGQLNESVMEKYGYRFLKSREGFETIDSFIENRIYRLFYIVFDIASFHHLNMEEEFKDMLEDAQNFLIQFKLQK